MGGSRGQSSPVKQVPLQSSDWDSLSTRVIPQQCQEPQALCQGCQSCRDLAGPLQCLGAGEVSTMLGPAKRVSSPGWGWPGQMAVAGQDVNCIVHQQLTAASVCPHQQWDEAVRHNRARGTQGGCRLLQPLRGSGKTPEQQDIATSCLGPCPTSLPPQINPCVSQIFPAPPDIPCLLPNILTPPSG